MKSMVAILFHIYFRYELLAITVICCGDEAIEEGDKRSYSDWKLQANQLIEHFLQAGLLLYYTENQTSCQ